jgi:transposase
MTSEQFVNHYPLLYHMAESGTWPSIRQRGLLSTLAVLDLVKVAPDLRTRLLTQRRAEIEEVKHPVLG